MFRDEIEQLYKFQSKEELVRKFSVVKQDRKSVVLYDFGELKWVVMPDDHLDIRIEDLELFKKYDSARVMFIRNPKFEDLPVDITCRKLTNDDNYKFSEFHKACPTLDKKSGSVSLADPTVYGCFIDNKLISVASLWNWGEKLSDIGVLTHPEYRGNGYAKNVCKMLMNETDKLFIWRCDESNEASYKLARSLGFELVGHIHCLRKE